MLFILDIKRENVLTAWSNFRLAFTDPTHNDAWGVSGYSEFPLITVINQALAYNYVCYDASYRLLGYINPSYSRGPLDP